MVAVAERMAGHEIRARCRTADFTQQTSGLAPGYVQCNIVILPADDAAHFESFCTLNPKPCPLLAVSNRPGDVSLPKLGTDIDIRTDVPQYRVWHEGVLTGQRHDIVELWQDVLCSWLAGRLWDWRGGLIRLLQWLSPGEVEGRINVNRGLGLG